MAPDPWEMVSPAFSYSPPRAYTIGPEVADLNALLGFTPDREQELILDEAFAVADDGLPAASRGLVIGFTVASLRPASSENVRSTESVSGVWRSTSMRMRLCDGRATCEPSFKASRTEALGPVVTMLPSGSIMPRVMAMVRPWTMALASPR